VGTIDSDVTNALSDHLPIWIGIALLDPFVLPSPIEKIPLAPRVDVDIHSDTEKLAYNEHLTTRLKTMQKWILPRAEADQGVYCILP
jgi:hypothetical protein